MQIAHPQPHGQLRRALPAALLAVVLTGAIAFVTTRPLPHAGSTAPVGIRVQAPAPPGPGATLAATSADLRTAVTDAERIMSAGHPASMMQSMPGMGGDMAAMRAAGMGNMTNAARDVAALDRHGMHVRLAGSSGRLAVGTLYLVPAATALRMWGYPAAQAQRLAGAEASEYLLFCERDQAGTLLFDGAPDTTHMGPRTLSELRREIRRRLGGDSTGAAGLR